MGNALPVASIFVTGSASGIGAHTAATLVAQGHRVVLHARDAGRAAAARRAVPGAAAVAVGDLASLAETADLARAADDEGPFDAVIHNAGVQELGPTRPVTSDGLERTFQVNVLAPYVLAARMARPRRLVVLTSGLQAQGAVDLDDLQRERRPWDGMQAYSDSKLCDVVLAFALARRWREVLTNAVDPGWIRTRMGGAAAPDDLPEGADTQVWLATSSEPEAQVTGRFFKRRHELRADAAAYDLAVQEGLLDACAALSGVPMP